MDVEEGIIIGVATVMKGFLHELMAMVCCKLRSKKKNQPSASEVLNKSINIYLYSGSEVSEVPSIVLRTEIRILPKCMFCYIYSVYPRKQKDCTLNGCQTLRKSSIRKYG